MAARVVHNEVYHKPFLDGKYVDAMKFNHENSDIRNQKDNTYYISDSNNFDDNNNFPS